jgi:hypothetical protein
MKEGRNVKVVTMSCNVMGLARVGAIHATIGKQRYRDTQQDI